MYAHSNRYTGAGTVRTLSAGTTFTLHGHDTTGALDADGNANTLVITRVVHQAYKNLTADLQSQIAHHLGLQAKHLDHDGIDNNINAAIIVCWL